MYYSIVWIISYNDIFKVLKFSCSDRDRLQRKNTLITSAVGSLKVCLRFAGFTFTHSSCGDGTFFNAGVPTINSTTHNETPLLTCHDSSNCSASTSGTGGRRLKAQIKVGCWVGKWVGRLLPFARKIQYMPFTSSEYAF